MNLNSAKEACCKRMIVANPWPGELSRIASTILQSNLYDTWRILIRSAISGMFGTPGTPEQSAAAKNLWYLLSSPDNTEKKDRWQ